MQSLYPEQGDDTAAKEGTAAHWVMAEMLEGVIVEVGSIAPNGVRVEPEMIEGAKLLRADVIAKLGPDWRSLIHIEERQPADPTLHPDNWGTPDVWAVVNGALFLWDYKYGFGYVEVVNNHQLINYFALIQARHELRNVRMTIVQPRWYGAGGPVRNWDVYAVELRAQVNILMNSFAEATGANPRLRVGSACEHCTARFACTELQRVGSLRADYAKMAAPFDLDSLATGRELLVLDSAIELLEARRSGLQEQAIRMIRAGKQVPGYAVGYGAGRTVWTKSAGEIINIGRLMAIDVAKPAEAVTPNQAVKRGLPEAVVKSLSTTPVGEAKLVRDDGATAAKVFGNK